MSSIFINQVLNLPRYAKNVIVIAIDLSLCIICTWLAFYLRLDEFVTFRSLPLNITLVSILLAIPIFWLSGLYLIIHRYSSLSIIFSTSVAVSVYGILYFSIVSVYGIPEVPRSIGLIQPILLLIAINTSRLSFKFLLELSLNFTRISSDKVKVLIYGAGTAGRQLLRSLENNKKYEVIGFIDDDHKLSKQVLLGKTIFHSSKLENLLESKNISHIFLALPIISRKERNKILDNLKNYKLIVKTLPSIEDIVDGKVSISDIKDLDIDDLLNREQVDPDPKLLSENIKFKTVVVTGAGGSIGSELCRQIVKLEPNKLLLIELNEFALYKAYEELVSMNKDLKIIALLVNAQDQTKLETIFETFKVDTVYHAAAYKHVPLVEENICEGVKNNVFSTLAIAKASIAKKVSNLVLISSDKAVRPTNIMGASKRLSELCMQGIYKHTNDISANFSIVRFGNVLETSGSVIPKFKKQIKEGGPITLTHRDVTRYFMTSTEAAQLVIQAGAMGKQSEVFILDMGQSVRIIDLIYKMVRLSGLSVKDDKNLNGDIEIEITGLRPGEKLYEELLIGDNPEKTDHIKIQKTNEPMIAYGELERELNFLKILLDKNEVDEVKILLEKLLKLYKPNSEIVDHIYIEQLSAN